MTQYAVKAPQKKPIITSKPSVPAAAKPARTPSHAEITAQAHALWEAKGKPAGQDKEIWLEAEAQLKKG